MEAVTILSEVANLTSNNDCSNLCSYQDMTFFVIFKKIFQKTNSMFSLQISKFSTLYLEAVRELSRVGNLASKMNTQIFLDFEIRPFLCFFSIIFRKLKFKFFFVFENPFIVREGAPSIFSEAVNLASDSYCSIRFIFRDMTFFVIFFKFSSNLFFFLRILICLKPLPCNGELQDIFRGCESCLQI